MPIRTRISFLFGTSSLPVLPLFCPLRRLTAPYRFFMSPCAVTSVFFPNPTPPNDFGMIACLPLHFLSAYFELFPLVSSSLSLPAFLVPRLSL